MAKELTFKLGPLKASFAGSIVNEVKAFRLRVRKFVDRYRTSGPGTISDDLEMGYQMLLEFIDEGEKLEACRLDLLSSERLLDLPISSYPDLKDIRQEAHKLKPIYDLYQDHESTRQEWACILWRDVKVQEIMNVTEDHMEKFKAQSRKMRKLPCARTLYNRLKNFQESLTLINYLKDEALRPRHWQQLMEKAGISFDIDPSTFTLEGVFAMELHHFSDVIAQIVDSTKRRRRIPLDQLSIGFTGKFMLTLFQR
ncbi:unnamed protein product [Protopolystoma xenopodis]|uniref:Dynein heavy chain linker domain-containing protein n=1 Tax=Protopolystoma xenopodis TaxID=117903 RepID=A0A3S4ZE53_9PLAT|nr:unnamed protein product [Protopolystoma xenopodis]